MALLGTTAILLVRKALAAYGCIAYVQCRSGRCPSRTLRDVVGNEGNTSHL